MGDDVVVLDLASSTYSTNATGTLLWKLLASGASRDELVDALVERFGVGRETVERDVDAFVADLGRSQLLAAES